MRNEKNEQVWRVVGAFLGLFVMILSFLIAYHKQITTILWNNEKTSSYTCSVTNEDGKPLQGAEVLLYTSGVPQRRFTDGFGICTFSQVPPSSDPRIVVSYQGKRKEFRLPAGALGMVDNLRLEQSPSELTPPAPSVERSSASDSEHVNDPQGNRSGSKSKSRTTKPTSRAVRVNQLARLTRRDVRQAPSTKASAIQSKPNLRTPENAAAELPVTFSSQIGGVVKSPEPLRMFVKEFENCQGVRDLLEELKAILPQAGFEIVDEETSKLVLEFHGCDAAESGLVLTLSSRKNPKHEIWSELLPKIRKNGLLQFNSGEAASYFFSELKANRDSIETHLLEDSDETISFVPIAFGSFDRK
jgi:hypothetical protein